MLISFLFHLTKSGREELVCDADEPKKINNSSQTQRNLTEEEKKAPNKLNRYFKVI